MRHALILAAFIAAPAVSQPAAPPSGGIVSGSASPASRGGAGAVDPQPGSQMPTPSIVGGAAARAAAPEPRCPDAAGRSRPCASTRSARPTTGG